jgi:epidermal growth factor receptor substrate 15
MCSDLVIQPTLTSGIFAGFQAKVIFERSRAPVEVLEKIWNLADTQQMGALRLTEFVVAMHLLTCYKSGALRVIPSVLPPGLHEAASRLTQLRTPASPPLVQRPTDLSIPLAATRRVSSLDPQLARSPAGSGNMSVAPLSAQTTGADWAVSPADKAQFDSVFNTIAKSKRGYISGDEAVRFFGNSKLPSETLAQIWDLSCIESNGQLNRDEFAVAMYLIRQERAAAARGGESTLPTVLPPNLIPPSMRRPTRTASQTFSPTAGFPQPAKPRSAADDLFELDNPTPLVAAEPQSTGGSNYDRNHSNASLPTELANNVRPPASQPSMFKPFVPTSSWGQTLVSSHATGASAASEQTAARALPASAPTSAEEDLLGDNDPEVSKKLTAETAELANLSNQVSSLSTQMQEVKTKSASTEAELSDAATHKRNFEARLSQLRSVYEQEVANVRSLEERLNECRNETKKLMRDIAMVEGSYEDINQQHRQALTALEADRCENAELKEKLRTLNTNLAALRSEFEKTKSEARQMKGLVAINRKQVAALEGERDKMLEDIKEAKKAAEAWPGDLGSASQTQQPAGAVTPGTNTPTPSTNPFARFSPPPTSAGGLPSRSSSSQQDTAGPSHPHAGTFDDLFGPVYSAPPQASSSPATPFAAKSGPENAGSPAAAQPAPDIFNMPAEAQGHTYPTRSQTASASSAGPSAAPPSRQVSSGSLLFRSDQSAPRSTGTPPNLPVSGSGQFGAKSGVDDGTPAHSEQASTSPAGQDAIKLDTTTTTGRSGGNEQKIAEDGGSSIFPSFTRSQTNPIPGAFPGDYDTPIVQSPMGDASRLPESGKPGTTAAPGATDDFDAAFAGFDAPKQASVRQTNGTMATGQPAAKPFHLEFPPIEKLGFDDDDSDSSSEHKFDDDFAPASPQNAPPQPATESAVPNSAKTGAGAPLLPNAGQARPAVTDGSTGGGVDAGRRSPAAAEAAAGSDPWSTQGSANDNVRADEAQESKSTLAPSYLAARPANDASSSSLAPSSAKEGEEEEEEGTAARRLAPAYLKNIPFTDGASKQTEGSPPPPDTTAAAAAAAPHSHTHTPDEFDDDDFKDLADAKPSDEKDPADFGLADIPADEDGLGDFNFNFDSLADSFHHQQRGQQQQPHVGNA